MMGIYTRASLRGLKAERDRQIHEQNVNTLVTRIKSAIITTATNTDKTTYFYPFICPTDTGDTKYKIMEDTLVRLREEFVDSAIEYKYQTDLLTGRELNHGIYIDWS